MKNNDLEQTRLRRLQELEEIQIDIMNGRDLPNYVYDRMNDLIDWTKNEKQ